MRKKITKKKIKRSIKKESLIPKRGKSLGGKTVYIGNLSYKYGENALLNLFSKFGKVNSINLVTVPGSDKSKGIAFVDMVKARDADKAIEYLNGKIVGGRSVKVSEAEDNSPLPVRKKKAITKKEEPIVQKRVVRKKKMKQGGGLEELFKNIGKKK